MSSTYKSCPSIQGILFEIQCCIKNRCRGGSETENPVLFIFGGYRVRVGLTRVFALDFCQKLRKTLWQHMVKVSNWNHVLMVEERRKASRREEKDIAETCFARSSSLLLRCSWSKHSSLGWRSWKQFDESHHKKPTRFPRSEDDILR